MSCTRPNVPLLALVAMVVVSIAPRVADAQEPSLADEAWTSPAAVVVGIGGLVLGAATLTLGTGMMIEGYTDDRPDDAALNFAPMERRFGPVVAVVGGGIVAGSIVLIAWGASTDDAPTAAVRLRGTDVDAVIRF